MSDWDEYKFIIDAYSPETIPMARLAEYMAGLAKLMANEDRVHFKKLDAGSTVVVAAIEREAVPKVDRRVEDAIRGAASDDVAIAFSNINNMLRDDNAVGKLQKVGKDNQVSAQILKFPGREVPRPTRIGPIKQPATVDGELVRIGGRSGTAHAQIEDIEGRTWPCELTRDLAKQLKTYLYEGPILRVSGEAKWERNEESVWELKNFRIHSYEILKDEPLYKAMERIKKIEGNEWSKMDDPLGFIHKMRKDDDGIH